MQEMSPPAHDMWLDMLKAAPTCGAHADLAGEPRPMSNMFAAAKVHGQHPRGVRSGTEII